MDCVGHPWPPGRCCSRRCRPRRRPALMVGAIYVGWVNDYGYNRSMHDGLWP